MSPHSGAKRKSAPAKDQDQIIISSSDSDEGPRTALRNRRFSEIRRQTRVAVVEKGLDKAQPIDISDDDSSSKSLSPHSNATAEPFVGDDNKQESPHHPSLLRGLRDRPRVDSRSSFHDVTVNRASHLGPGRTQEEPDLRDHVSHGDTHRLGDGIVDLGPNRITAAQKSIRGKDGISGLPITMSEVEEELHRLLEEMGEDHTASMKALLRFAREACDRRLAQGQYTDSTSPFLVMPGIDSPNGKAVRGTGGIAKLEIQVRFHVRHVRHVRRLLTDKKEHKASAKNCTVPVTSYVAAEAAVPSYKAYTTLKCNVFVDGDEDLRYFPYFGDSDDDDSEIDLLYKDRVKEFRNSHRRAEKAARFVFCIRRFLGRIGSSTEDVVQYLFGDLESILATSREVREAIRKRSALLPRKVDSGDATVRALLSMASEPQPSRILVAHMACSAFHTATDGLSLWEVIRKEATLAHNASPVKPTRPTPTSNTADRSSASHPMSLETYTSLGCLICFRHVCPGHAEHDSEDTWKGIVGPAASNLTSPTGRSLSTIGMDEHAGGNNATEPAVCSESCFHKEENLRRAPSSEWTVDQIILLETLMPAYSNYEAASCFLRLGIRKPCAEIYAKLHSLRIDREDQTDDTSEPEAATSSTKNKRIASKIDWTETKTANHDNRVPFVPCFHKGACRRGVCDCFDNDVACEKQCFCPGDCDWRFRGCLCAKKARACSREKCICWRLNRECDADLCGACGARELVDPANRGNSHLLDHHCSNVNLQLGKPKRTFLGNSQVAGYGLFMGETVKTGEYLGEYTGEIVSTDEADRRGRIYDKRGLSYLFDLNKDQVIDATRAGNKFRFINNSTLSDNCKPKVLLVNGVHRIGMFAHRNLNPGDELFFNYGYTRETLSFVSIELGNAASKLPANVAQPSKDKKAGARLQATAARPRLEDNDENDEEMQDAASDGWRESDDDSSSERRPPIRRTSGRGRGKRRHG